MKNFKENFCCYGSEFLLYPLILYNFHAVPVCCGFVCAPYMIMGNLLIMYRSMFFPALVSSLSSVLLLYLVFIFCRKILNNFLFRTLTGENTCQFLLELYVSIDINTLVCSIYATPQHEFLCAKKLYLFHSFEFYYSLLYLTVHCRPYIK